MRREELMGRSAARQASTLHSLSGHARRLLQTYAGLAQRGEHLLGSLLAGQAPRQWNHYPQDDAIDRASGFQWFYHSHGAADRPAAREHGHIHLFAQRRLWSRRLQSGRERDFARLCGWPQAQPETRHLLAIGLDAKGVPTSLFTVNSWVTGDLMLSTPLTLRLLASMSLHTDHAEVDAVIESVIQLCMPDIRQLLAERDAALRAHPAIDQLAHVGLEVLSEVSIDLDSRLLQLG